MMYKLSIKLFVNENVYIPSKFISYQIQTKLPLFISVVSGGVHG